MNKRSVVLLVMAMAYLVALTACDQPPGISQVNSSDVKMKTDAKGMTAEQANIKKRYELASDANALWWIYCLADNGQVVYFGAVKGKVTSSGKALSSNSGSKDTVYMNWDGSYGSSDSYVYWFDPQNIYYQWSGHYFLTSREVKIKESVLNMRSVQ